MTLMFVDTETGGLDHAKDPLIEVAWTTDGKVKSLTLPHDPADVRPKAAEINKYYERELDNKDKWASPQQVADMLNEWRCADHMVAANPTFDYLFLRANNLYVFPHYRMLDIESYCAGKLGLDRVPSMSEIYDMLINFGYYDLPEPDHTAAGDVRTMYHAFQILRYK